MVLSQVPLPVTRVCSHSGYFASAISSASDSPSLDLCRIYTLSPSSFFFECHFISFKGIFSTIKYKASLFYHLILIHFLLSLMIGQNQLTFVHLLTVCLWTTECKLHESSSAPFPVHYCVSSVFGNVPETWRKLNTYLLNE